MERLGEGRHEATAIFSMSPTRWHSLPKTDLSYGGLEPESWDSRAEDLEDKKRLFKERAGRLADQPLDM